MSDIQSSCEYCSNYEYDEECDAYMCEVEMDEDDYARQMEGRSSNAGCPYFSYDDEYKIVRHQM